MMRPTRRICRRPPELQAANARAFSKGTPSSRRAFARDTWRKLKNSDLGKKCDLSKWRKKDEAKWHLNFNFQSKFKERTYISLKKKHPASGLQYWIHFWDMFKHVFFLISRGRVRLQTSKVTKRKRKWRILCWEKKKDLNGSNHLIHSYPTKSQVFLLSQPWESPGPNLFKLAF